MRNVEKRILRQKKLVAKKIQAAKVCNYRAMRTSFHNTECLEALLMSTLGGFTPASLLAWLLF